MALSFSKIKKHTKFDDINLTHKPRFNLNNGKIYQAMHQKFALSKMQSRLESDSNNLNSDVVESGFASVSSNSNRYTQGYPFVKNKEMALYKKYQYDNDKYIPDRTKQFSMSNLSKIHVKNGILYKTTNFRNGHYILNGKEDKKLIKVLQNYDNEIKNSSNSSEYEQKPMKTMPRIIKNKKSRPYEPSPSLYKELRVNFNEVMGNFLPGKRSETSPGGKSSVWGEKSWVLNKKYKDNIPLVFPVSLTYKNCYSSMSELQRYQKISDEFLKIKHLISIEPSNEDEILRQYLRKKNIEENLVTDINLKNLSKFLKEDEIKIDPEKSLKDNLTSILLHGDASAKEQKEMFSTQISNFYPKRHKEEVAEEEERRDLYDILDLDKQKKLTSTKPKKTIAQICTDLETELNDIRDAQIQLEKERELESLEREYKPVKISRNRNNLRTEDLNQSTEIRLSNVLDDEMEVKKKKKPKQRVSTLKERNERLYYSNIEKKNGFDVETFRKKNKLTEFIMFEKLRRKIELDKLKERYLS